MKKTNIRSKNIRPIKASKKYLAYKKFERWALYNDRFSSGDDIFVAAYLIGLRDGKKKNNEEN